jgi:hypothetical protein
LFVLCLESCRELDLLGTSMDGTELRYGTAGLGGLSTKPLRSLAGLGSRKETDIHGTWQAMPVVTEQRLHASSPGGTWGSRSGKGWHDGKQTSAAWKAREIEAAEQANSERGAASQGLGGPGLLPRQRCIDSPITARTLHYCAPHCPSAAPLIGPFILCRCCHSSSGLDRCSADGSVLAFAGSSHNSDLQRANDPHELTCGHGQHDDMLAASGNSFVALWLDCTPVRPGPKPTGWSIPSHRFGTSRSSIVLRPAPTHSTWHRKESLRSVHIRPVRRSVRPSLPLSRGKRDGHGAVETVAAGSRQMPS